MADGYRSYTTYRAGRGLGSLLGSIIARKERKRLQRRSKKLQAEASRLGASAGVEGDTESLLRILESQQQKAVRRIGRETVREWIKAGQEGAAGPLDVWQGGEPLSQEALRAMTPPLVASGPLYEAWRRANLPKLREPIPGFPPQEEPPAPAVPRARSRGAAAVEPIIEYARRQGVGATIPGPEGVNITVPPPLGLRQPPSAPPVSLIERDGQTYAVPRTERPTAVPVEGLPAATEQPTYQPQLFVNAATGEKQWIRPGEPVPSGFEPEVAYRQQQYRGLIDTSAERGQQVRELTALLGKVYKLRQDARKLGRQTVADLLGGYVPRIQELSGELGRPVNLPPFDLATIPEVGSAEATVQSLIDQRVIRDAGQLLTMIGNIVGDEDTVFALYKALYPRLAALQESASVGAAAPQEGAAPTPQGPVLEDIGPEQLTGAEGWTHFQPPRKRILKVRAFTGDGQQILPPRAVEALARRGDDVAVRLDGRTVVVSGAFLGKLPMTKADRRQVMEERKLAVRVGTTAAAAARAAQAGKRAQESLKLRKRADQRAEEKHEAAMKKAQGQVSGIDRWLEEKGAP